MDWMSGVFREPRRWANVFGWGLDNNGELGRGRITYVSRIPIRLLGIENRIQISSGNATTIILTRDREVWGFGNNMDAQINMSSISPLPTPTQIPTPDNIISISSGTFHNGALRNDGSVWLWGLRPGTGTRIPPTLQSGVNNITSIDLGWGHTLALRNDGTVWAWGWNGGGQLGDGTSTTSATIPVQTLIINIVAISAGGESNSIGHSLAIRNDNTVWAWGSNGAGQLGDGTTTNRLSPVQVTGLTGITAISAGTLHSLARRNDGTVWAWGRNGEGRLGDGTTTNRLSPVQVTGLTGITAVSAGDRHSLALRDDGTVWAWGWNGEGQLGDGTSVQRLTPIQTIGLVGATQIYASTFSTSFALFPISPMFS